MKFLLPSIIALFIASNIFAQEEIGNWDNNLYLSNKFSWGKKETLKQSAEFQSRFNNNLAELEQWYLEYSASYLVSKTWEIVPDFRFTRKPSRLEYRPGLGVIYKRLYTKSQLVHQFKYQYDFKNGVNDAQGLRYALFYNYLFSENFIGSVFAGGLFEFGKDFNGFLGLRSGVNAAYVFNKAHSVNLGYYYGLINDKTGHYNHVGILSIQLIINIRKDYKYLPARYFNL